MAQRANLSGTIETSMARASDAGTTAELVILAADELKIPQIHGLILSTNTAGTYSVKIGDTVVLSFYLADASGYSERFHPLYLTNNAVDEAITLEKPILATTSVTLFYTLEIAL